jgi:hypothetical protein
MFCKTKINNYVFACFTKRTSFIMFCKTSIICYVLLRQAEFEPSTSPLPSKTTGSLPRRLLRSLSPYVTVHSKFDEEKSKYAGLAQENCFGSA